MGHIKKGELTQEEKELLEVIGKGTGAGWYLHTWSQGTEEPGARPRPGGPWATCNPEKAFLSLARDRLQGRRDGRQKN